MQKVRTEISLRQAPFLLVQDAAFCVVTLGCSEYSRLHCVVLTFCGPLDSRWRIAMKNLQPGSAFYPISPRYLFKICAGLLMVICIGSCGGSSNSPTTNASAGDASGTT